MLFKNGRDATRRDTANEVLIHGLYFLILNRKMFTVVLFYYNGREIRPWESVHYTTRLFRLAVNHFEWVYPLKENSSHSEVEIIGGKYGGQEYWSVWALEVAFTPDRQWSRKRICCPTVWSRALIDVLWKRAGGCLALEAIGAGPNRLCGAKDIAEWQGGLLSLG